MAKCTVFKIIRTYFTTAQGGRFVYMRQFRRIACLRVFRRVWFWGINWVWFNLLAYLGQVLMQRWNSKGRSCPAHISQLIDSGAEWTDIFIERIGSSYQSCT